MKGQGIPRDYAQAAHWFGKAAEQGLAAAQYSLGGMYKQGEGVPKDNARAAHWFRKAAEQGDAEAQYYIGSFYYFDLGVRQDYQQAYFWLSLAAAEGVEQAAERRDKAAKKLWPQQITAVQQRVRNWRPSKAAPSSRQTGTATAALVVSATVDRGLVMDVQRHLEGLDYDPGPVDGIMGRRTENAIRAFQRFAGLTVTGDVSPGLVERLREAEAAQAVAAAPGPDSPEKAAEPVDAQAQLSLGISYMFGQGVPQDNAQGVRWIRKAAEQGLMVAQYYIGSLYHSNLGVPEDYEQAYFWLSLAAAEGDEQVVKRRDEAAKKLTPQQIAAVEQRVRDWRPTKAAPSSRQTKTATVTPAVPTRGLVMDVQRRLAGLGYDPGPADGIMGGKTGNAIRAFQRFAGLTVTGEVSPGLAERLREVEGAEAGAASPEPASPDKAAEPVDAIAQFSLGLSYAKGQGVPQDDAQAVYWFRKAAEQGDARAQYNLGLFYQLGKGVSQDYAEAIRWYRKAAEQGHAKAQYKLGDMYYVGRGISQDFRQAYFWYSLAVAEEVEEAAKWRDKAAEQLTSQQIAAIQQRVRNWRPSKAAPSP